MAILPKSGPLNNHIVKLLKEGKNNEQIEADLLQNGHDRRFVKIFIQEARDLRSSQVRAKRLAVLYTVVRLIIALLLAYFLVTRHNNITTDDADAPTSQNTQN